MFDAKVCGNQLSLIQRKRILLLDIGHFRVVVQNQKQIPFQTGHHVVNPAGGFSTGTAYLSQ